MERSRYRVRAGNAVQMGGALHGPGCELLLTAAEATAMPWAVEPAPAPAAADTHDPDAQARGGPAEGSPLDAPSGAEVLATEEEAAAVASRAAAGPHTADEQTDGELGRGAKDAATPGPRDAAAARPGGGTSTRNPKRRG